MTIDEAKQAFAMMKKQGADDKTILGFLYNLFQNDKIDVNQLGALVNVLGYELADDFKKMSPEDQKTKGYKIDESVRRMPRFYDDVMVVSFGSKNLVCKQCKYGAITDPYNTFCAFYKVKPNSIYCEGKPCEHFEQFPFSKNNNSSKVDEVKKAFEEMRAQGADDNAILGTLYTMFQDDKIDINQLDALVNILGYELTDEFKNMSTEEQKINGWEIDNSEKENKIKGCLLGGAIGDALGYPIEFMSYRNIVSKYGKNGIENFELHNGVALISDDTQMTIFTAEGLINGYCNKDLSIKYVYWAYLDWLKTQGYKVRCPGSENTYCMKLSDEEELNHRRAPCNTCLSALLSGKMGTIKTPINSSKGCGGVMRVAPIGLFLEKFDNNLDRVTMFAAEAAAITHGHELGYIPAAAFARIIALLYRGQGIKYAVDNTVEAINRLFSNARHLTEFNKIINLAVELSSRNINDVEAINKIGQGWVGEEALAIAIYCSLKYPDDFTKAVCAAVNHDGDSDSTGAITGNIMGTLLGESAIPEKYLENLELYELIQDRICGSVGSGH